MGKIDEFVKANGIKPSDCKFHTIRSIKNEKGDAAGRSRVLVWKNDLAVAHTEMTCPKCKKDSYQKLPWNDFKSESGRKSPFVVICPHCQYKLEIRKMNEEAKRDQKKAAKEE